MAGINKLNWIVLLLGLIHSKIKTELKKGCVGI
jgi:hypothetical protein